MRKYIPRAISLILVLSALGISAAVNSGEEPPRLPREPVYPGQAPADVSDTVLDARDLVMQRRYDEAERLLWKLTRSRPDDPTGPTALMVVLQIRMLENEENFLDAEMRRVIAINRSALEKFRQKAPRNAWYYTLVGASQGVEGIYHLWRDEYVPAGVRGYASIQSMKKALKVEPLNWEARLGLGVYMYYRSIYASKAPFLPDSMDRSKEGLREIELAGKKRLYLYETSRIALCRIHMDGKRWAEARKISDELIAQYPHFLIFYLFSARATFRAGNFRRALTYYEKAYRIDPSLPFAPYRMGVCNEKPGNLAEAARWFKIAAEAGAKRNPDKWGTKAQSRLEMLKAGNSQNP